MKHVTRNIILFIDSSNPEKVILALITSDVKFHAFESRQLSETLLSELKKFLRKQKISFQDLSTIAVVVGPGMFSRLRTGIAVANALALGLNLPLIPIERDSIPKNLKNLGLFPKQKMAIPVYDKQPNITKSTKSYER